MHDVPQLQIKVLVRFSYPAENGFQVSEQDPKVRRAALYHADRLNWRLHSFQKLCLHSLLRQTGPAFEVGVLIGRDLPEPVHRALSDLLRPHANMHLIALPPMAHYTAISRAFARLPDRPGASHTVTVRLDDDDALHGQTLARLAYMAQGLVALRDPQVPLAIGFNRGFFVSLGQPGKAVEVVERTPLGIGLALVAPVGQAVNIFRRNHRWLGQFFDLYTDTQFPAWVRTVHPGNDSAAVRSGVTLDTPQQTIADHLQKGFGLALDDLEAMKAPIP